MSTLSLRDTISSLRFALMKMFKKTRESLCIIANSKHIKADLAPKEFASSRGTKRTDFYLV